MSTRRFPASRRSLALAASTIALLAGAPAFAQNDTAAADKADTNEIIVTAQFREQNLQDTPLAITAVNAETMEAKNQTNLSQVADRAPNVSLKQQGGSFGPSVSIRIRGVGASDFHPAYEPGVGIYIDDVYYPQLTGAMFDLLDLDRVEILRGPQGTLAGRNSEGGSIKMYSKKPSGDNGGFVEGTYGSRNKIGLRASADFALTDELAGRISGVYKRQDGYVDQLDFGCVNPPGSANNPAVGGIAPLVGGDCKVGEFGDTNYQAIRGILRYKSSAADIDVSLSADYTHDERGNAAEILNAVSGLNTPNSNPSSAVAFDSRFMCGKFCNYATFSAPAANWVWGGPPLPTLNAYDGQNRAKYDGYNFANNVHIGLNDRISVDNIIAYGQYTASFDADDDLSPAPINAGHNKLTHWHWSEELRLNFNPIDTVTMVAGGYYFKQNTTYYSYQDIRYVGIPLQFQQPDVIEANSKAVFANASWEIVPNLNLNGGIRYTKEAKTYNYFRLNLDGTINAFLDPVGAANGAGTPGALTGNPAIYDGSNTDWRVALDYRFSPELLVYASVSTGFKGGGTNPRPFNAYQAVGFGPEKLTNYELGFKSDLLDRRLRLNVTGFLSKYSDIQIGVSECPLLPGAPPGSATPCAGTLNAGKGEFKGIEAELTAEPVDGFTIDGSMSYLDFKYTDLLASAEYDAVTNRGGVEKEDPPIGTPKWKWSLGAQYAIDLGSAGSITPRVDVEYTGRQFASVYVHGTPTVRDRIFIDAYTTVNGRLSWRNEAKDLEISLEGRNLTNKYYYLQLFDLRGAGAGFSKALVAPPREVAITVRKKF